MILKINRKSKGRKGPVEYLLNEREEEGTAITLRGNPEITKSLIRNIERKHKYLSGGLMFTKEEYINENQINQIMDTFEEVLFAGLTSDQYNILWVEHNDKGRLELNFVVPRVELSTGYDLDLYSHKRDLPIFDMWKNGINAKYNLADPNDPRRARIVSKRTNTVKGIGTIVANRKNIDETLHNLVEHGKIQNRNQMIELLKQNDYEITRKNSGSISIRHNDIGTKALRLKGIIYSESFTSIENISKERELQIIDYDNKVTQVGNKKPREIYKEYLQTRIERHKRRYLRVNSTYRIKPQIISKLEKNNLLRAISDKEQRIKIDDRIRNLIKYNITKREEYIGRAKERERQILEHINDYNDELSISHRRTEEELFIRLASTRNNVEKYIERDTKRIDEEAIIAGGYNKRNSSRVYELFEKFNEQYSRLGKSIKGVINEIKKLKLFNMAKADMMSKRNVTKNISRRKY